MIVAVVAAVLGLALGVAIGAAIAGRRPAPPRVEASATDGAPAARDEMQDVLLAALDQLDLSVVVADRRARIRHRNRAAQALSGTHVGVIVDEHLDAALARALDGRSTSKRIDLHGPPRASLELQAESIADGWAVAIVDDVSERRRIDAMRTDFVANISHELKTPVGAIAVLAEMLEGELDRGVIARLAARIGSESMRAVSTIDDLLELSRIESTRVGDEVVDLASVVEVAVARGRDVDPGKGVEVVASGQTGEIRLRGDRRQLTSAIGNLVENAVKFSEPGGSVEVQTGVVERRVEIIVIDRGVGIPERDLDRVFERFYRVDRARSRDTGGTGLGLSIVRHVASNHGGEVTVSSQEGQGSTFVLRLPVSLLVDAETDEGVSPPADARRSAPVPADAAGADGGGRAS